MCGGRGASSPRRLGSFVLFHFYFKGVLGLSIARLGFAWFQRGVFGLFHKVLVIVYLFSVSCAFFSVPPTVSCFSNGFVDLAVLASTAGLAGAV